MQRANNLVMEFHVSRLARDRYQFSETLFSLHSNVVFSNFHAARLFAQQMNDRRDLARYPEQTVKASHLNAMGLVDEILHYMFARYREQNPDVLHKAFAYLEAKLDASVVNHTLLRFVDLFPPVSVYKKEIEAQTYLAGSTDGVPHRHIVLEELLMLWLANMNPAFEPFLELFDDSTLVVESSYREIIASLEEFFEGQPGFGGGNVSLIAFLRAPALAHPHSLAAQLRFILEKWGTVLGRYFCQLLLGQDLIKEEEQAHGLGAGPAEVYQFTGQETEPERFSPDRDWMPRLVLMAKNIYVWLDQMSKKYRRPIRTLDKVPDEELDTLARWGFTGLWLIGLWERSRASQKIKQLCGNPEAVASAYSLHDYHIAGDLGGVEAFQNLKERAWRRGIRMASDMVPNHMGIDSRWVVEHPDWFLALDHPPYPSYQFNGPDLSNDDRVGIFLEDHYYSRSDAAVVFKRVDRWTGSTRYVYHGNDGTSMPWNDTAQLNFLDPQVREAVIQTILHVARQFPIIRFDAAMTLAKRHIQRLWFPEPGSGGAIPSRAEHGLTKEQFDQRVPNEFWREVVDRVAAEIPDTLLLAEAFWMMEGYFVRTLGMHRVYNSAFMNMLKNEENANYRSVMKNTLEFNPEILKRFVNFMNNPDEDTAVAQFGKDDKYIGVCTLMATLPGLPMFGHGQIEGFTEKYGMEYRRAYWDEKIDEHLLRRHEREIFPLLRRRYLFAEVDNFYLYDLFTPEGHVNEDVFAFSNRYGDERVLVIYQNKYATAQGWIRQSVGYMGKTGTGEERVLMQRTLAEGLDLDTAENAYCIFRDHRTGLEYIRRNRDLIEQGLFVDLHAYACHVFLDFRQVRSSETHPYAEVAANLSGRGVASVDEALRELKLRPILDPLKQLVNATTFQQFLNARTSEMRAFTQQELLETVERDQFRFLRALDRFCGGKDDEALATTVAAQTRRLLEAALTLPALQMRYDWTTTSKQRALWCDIKASIPDDDVLTWGCLFGWIFTHNLGGILGKKEAIQRSRTWFDELMLGRVLGETLRELGVEENKVPQVTRLVGLLISQQGWYTHTTPEQLRSSEMLQSLLKDSEGQKFLGVNRYNDVLWYVGEAYDAALSWLFVIALVHISAQPPREITPVPEILLKVHQVLDEARRAGETSGYRVDKLLEAVEREVRTK